MTDNTVNVTDNTVRAKYIFLDIVGYSHGRSVEAQTEIISVLNEIVQNSLSVNSLSSDDLVLLPTGDGICIAITNSQAPYDVHLRTALAILEKLSGYNSTASDEMRRFQVRIGLNENVDNRVIDINGRLNIAGAGINLAQRVMSAGDGGQILVSAAVCDTLRHRELYMKAFKEFGFTSKHSLAIRVHQYVAELPYLNIETPRQFRPISSPPKKMSRFVAYYIANANHYRRNLGKMSHKLG